MKKINKIKVLKKPEIETKRLYIRPFRLSDAKDRLNQGNFKDENGRIIKSLEELKRNINGLNHTKHGYFVCVFLKGTKEQVATVDITNFDWFDYTAGEIAYGCPEEHRGKGYPTEAVRAVIDYLFREIKINKITADTNPKNLPSKRILIKLGFVLEGIAREKWCKQDGTWSDEENWGLLRREWIKLHKKPFYKKLKK